MALIAFVALVTAAALGFFIVEQRRRGRFRRAATLTLDRISFETSVGAFPAEVVGAAVDETVGADEVKAILARLMLENKIAAKVVDGVFRLRLLVPRPSFAPGYEAQLVCVLFVAGEAIDRETLVKHWTEKHKLVPDANYELSDLPEILTTQYFDPAAEIADTLLEEGHRFTAGVWGMPKEEPTRALFSDLTREREELVPPGRVRNVMAWVYPAILSLGYGTLAERRKYDFHDEHWLTVDLQIVLCAGFALHLLAFFLADRVRRKPSISIGDVLVFGTPMLLLPAIAIARGMSGGVKFVTAVLFAGSMLNVMLRARSGSIGLQNDMRHVLAAARTYLEAELSSGAPAIPLAWLPHLFAFGLGDRVDPCGAGTEVFEPVGGVAEWNRHVSKLVERFASRVVERD